jgi:hypothetical protein
MNRGISLLTLAVLAASIVACSSGGGARDRLGPGRRDGDLPATTAVETESAEWAQRFLSPDRPVANRVSSSDHDVQSEGAPPSVRSGLLGDLPIPLATLRSYRYRVQRVFTGAMADDWLKNYGDTADEKNAPGFVPARGTGKPLNWSATGAVVRPDRQQQSWRINNNTLTFWDVGDKIWRQYNHRPVEILLDTLDRPYINHQGTFGPATYWDRDGLEWWGQVGGDNLVCLDGLQRVNNLSVRDCVSPGASIAGVFNLAAVLSDATGVVLDRYSEARFRIYLLPDRNLPVRMKFYIKGETKDGRSGSLDFQMDLWDINSDAVRVDAPR